MTLDQLKPDDSEGQFNQSEVKKYIKDFYEKDKIKLSDFRIELKDRASTSGEAYLSFKLTDYSNEFNKQEDYLLRGKEFTDFLVTYLKEKKNVQVKINPEGGINPGGVHLWFEKEFTGPDDETTIDVHFRYQA